MFFLLLSENSFLMKTGQLSHFISLLTSNQLINRANLRPLVTSKPQPQPRLGLRFTRPEQLSIQAKNPRAIQGACLSF